MHNIHKREKAMLPAGFEPAVPASERPKNYALDPVATGIGRFMHCTYKKSPTNGVLSQSSHVARRLMPILVIRAVTCAQVYCILHFPKELLSVVLLRNNTLILS